MNASNPPSDSNGTAADPVILAREGAMLYEPANAVDRIRADYQAYRLRIDPIWGEGEFSDKVRKNTDPLEENLDLYLGFLADGLRTAADYTLETARSFQVVEETAAETGKNLQSNINDYDGGNGGGRR